MVFVEKVESVAVLAKRLVPINAFAVTALELIVSATIEDTNSCCALTVTPIAVLKKMELVKTEKVDNVLGSVANPPPVVTPIIDDAYKTRVLML